MAVIYECDAEGCEQKDYAMCAVAHKSDGTSSRILLPPYRWRMLDIPSRQEPVVLCPGCGARVEEHQRAANDSPTLKKRPKLGVLDGGKGKGEDEPT